MKLKKQQKNPYDKILDFFIPIEKNINFIYLFIMLGIFPLYVKDQYNGIGDAKFDLFFRGTRVFLPLLSVILLTKMIFWWKKQMFDRREPGRLFKEKKEGSKISFLDQAVFSYGFLVSLSYLLSDYKEYSLRGADGWQMGLLSQLMFIGLYFLLSFSHQSYLSLLIVHMTASALTFLLGIFHRFQIDPLDMYEGLTLLQMTEFLSTIGQATWYSSYICTVFPLGLVGLYMAKGKIGKILCRVYAIITFSVLVTQNSDSAFVALAGILVILALYSCTEKQNWITFLEIMILMWGSFTGIGMLQRVFRERVIPLGSLSTFFSQNILSMFLLVVSILFYAAYGRLAKEREEKVMKMTSRVIISGSILAAVSVVILVLVIFLNTKGYLFQWFGIQIEHNYLLFDETWGNNRGMSWMIAWQEYRELPLHQKLFGVGPDAFSEHLYSIPEIQQRLQHKWGNLRLTNAHNEYLNSLVCYGIIGLLSWLTVLIGGVVYFYQKAKEQKNFGPVILGFSLCIMGYLCHNIFCYQQVCCTPFLFIGLGLGEGWIRRSR